MDLLCLLGFCCRGGVNLDVWTETGEITGPLTRWSEKEMQCNLFEAAVTFTPAAITTAQLELDMARQCGYSFSETLFLKLNHNLENVLKHADEYEGLTMDQRARVHFVRFGFTENYRRQYSVEQYGVDRYLFVREGLVDCTRDGCEIDASAGVADVQSLCERYSDRPDTWFPSAGFVWSELVIADECGLEFEYVTVCPALQSLVTSPCPSAAVSLLLCQ
jgi:hypothetical protein